MVIVRMRSRIRAEILKRVTAAGLASVVFTGMGCGDSCEKRSARPEAKHVLRHRRLRYGEAELQQFAVDSWCAPERIGAAHPPNQISQLRTNQGPTGPSATLPRPVASETQAVPPHHRSGCTSRKELRQLVQSLDNTTQEIRSIALNCGRGWRAFHTASCCRSASFSSANSRCVRTELLSAPKRIPSHRTMTGEIADQSAECKLITPDHFLEGTPGPDNQHSQSTVVTLIDLPLGFNWRHLKTRSLSVAFRSEAHAAVGHAADENIGAAKPGIAADDDEIGALVVGRGCDHVRRVPGRHLCAFAIVSEWPRPPMGATAIRAARASAARGAASTAPRPVTNTRRFIQSGDSPAAIATEGSAGRASLPSSR
jgi:hypothetical protein